MLQQKQQFTKQIDIALHLEIDLVMTRVLLLHKTLDHDMTILKEIRDPIALLTDLLTDPLTDMTLVTDIDHARIQEITTSLQDTHLPLDHLHGQEILDLLDPVHIQIHRTSLIQFNHKPKLIQLTSFEVHMYHPTKMANAVTTTSWLYSLYTQTPSNQIQRDYPSRFEISFLLDSGASISVLNYLTYGTIAKLLKIKQYTQSLKNFDCCKSHRRFPSTLCYCNFKHNNRR